MFCVGRPSAPSRPRLTICRANTGCSSRSTPSTGLRLGPIYYAKTCSIIGAPFYLMERRRGLVVRRDVPEEIGDDHGLRRRVSRAMVETLAALHAVNIYSTGLCRTWKARRICHTAGARVGGPLGALED